MASMRTVVLVDDHGNPLGPADRDAVHGIDTPLHLAFSCYLFDTRGRVLLSRRALSKRTWPGVWTNSFCGHPQWGEPMPAAIERHAANELGVRVSAIRELLPDFRYRAVDSHGTVENEICPVFAAVTHDNIDPNPDEVADWAWVEPAAMVAAMTATPQVFSPWAVLQISQASHMFEPSGVAA